MKRSVFHILDTLKSLLRDMHLSRHTLSPSVQLAFTFYLHHHDSQMYNQILCQPIMYPLYSRSFSPRFQSPTVKRLFSIPMRHLNLFPETH
jgi:hypothetical protein